MAKEKDKDAILLAAQNVFAKKGIGNASLEEIAREAKLDAKSLKSVYNSTDAMLDEIIGRDIDETSELFTKFINDR